MWLLRDNDLRPGIIRSAIEYLSAAPRSRPVPTACKEKKAARDKERIEQPLRRHGYMRIAVSLHASFFVTFLHPAPMNLHTKREDAHQKTPPAYTEGVFHTTKDHAASADALESPSLSLAGQTAIVNQAVLLAPVPRAPAPSRGKSLSGGDNVPMQVCSLLQWRDRSGLGRIIILFTGFSIKSSRNLNIIGISLIPDPIRIKLS